MTGASGKLGRSVLRVFSRDSSRGSGADGAAQPVPTLPVLALSGRQTGGQGPVPFVPCDLAASDTWVPKVASFRPTHILHLGAVTSVAGAFEDPARAQRVNEGATKQLCELAEQFEARFVFASTDMVFDGTAAPYAESDSPKPASRYGQTKAAAETLALSWTESLVCRVALMYGPTPGDNRFAQFLKALQGDQPLRLFQDEHRTPLSYEDAANALVVFARSPMTGRVHLAGPERVSRYSLGERIAHAHGIKSPSISPASREELEAPEPRPADLSLAIDRLQKEYPELVPRAVEAAMHEGE